ncbi:MAG: hypothetical protein J2P13_00875 [Acidobacteria bacterium]|nr:hypothetical protein [Acidobacteriota bacterium]
MHGLIRIQEPGASSNPPGYEAGDKQHCWGQRGSELCELSRRFPPITGLDQFGEHSEEEYL